MTHPSLEGLREACRDADGPGFAVSAIQHYLTEHSVGLFGDGLVPDERDEIERLRSVLDSPDPHEFFEACEVEARFQQAKWGMPMQPGTTHDSHKSDADWFWLIGYLAGKALHRPGDDSTEKMLHRITTIAAACANWHAAVKAREGE